MDIGRIIDNIVFFGREPQEAIKWEELRKKILEAIDEERERGATIITSPSNMDSMVCGVHELTGYKRHTHEVAGSTYHTHELEVYAGTADEDSYVYGREDALKVTVA